MAYRSRDHGPYRKYTYLDLGDLDLIALQEVDRVLTENIEDFQHHPVEVRLEQQEFRVRVAAARLKLV